MAVKKKIIKKAVKKSVKKVSKPVAKKPVKNMAKSKSTVKTVEKSVSKPLEIVFPKKLAVKPRDMIIVYGMRVDKDKVMRAAIEAYNKRKYTVNDIKLPEYGINDPKFRNLTLKIAVLDRIEEEIFRLYPDAEPKRPNTLTLLIE